MKVTTKGDGKGLKSMIVEQDDIVSAVVYCKDDTLIAAQLPKDSFPSDDDLIGKAQNLGLRDNDPVIGQIHENEGGSSDESSVEDEDGASSSSKGKGKVRSEDAEEEENKPSKVRILELRAEAMAEVLVEDELKDFVMPKDFH